MQSKLNEILVRRPKKCNCDTCKLCKNRIHARNWYKKHKNLFYSKKRNEISDEVLEQKLNEYWEKVKTI